LVAKHHFVELVVTMAAHALNQTFVNVWKDLRDLHACLPYAARLVGTAENVLGLISVAVRTDLLVLDAKRNAVLSRV